MGLFMKKTEAGNLVLLCQCFGSALVFWRIRIKTKISLRIRIQVQIIEKNVKGLYNYR